MVKGIGMRTQVLYVYEGREKGRSTYCIQCTRPSALAPPTCGGEGLETYTHGVLR